jgi:hypothetical protein
VLQHSKSFGGWLTQDFPRRLFCILSACYVELLKELRTHAHTYTLAETYIHIYIYIYIYIKQNVGLLIELQHVLVSIKKAAEQLISYHVFFNLIGGMDMSYRLRGLRRGFVAGRLMRLRVRIPPEAWMSLSCECCVFAGRGLCVGLVTRPEESYRVCCV